MKYINKNQVTKSLNPFLGFGWNTGTGLKKETLNMIYQKNKSHLKIT